MKLLLINPKFPESFWSLKWVNQVILKKRTTNPPLGLATLAALCPADWEVEIVDENIETIPFDPRADIIGICGMGVQFERQKELLAYYKKKGFFVVAGGSYASLCPEEYEPLVDSVVAGEAEYIWKRFCEDFQAGTPKKLYRETGVVSLEDSPTPRFDLLDLDKYQGVSLQFSRGCPFRCDFCDIIVMFGRKPRAKSLQQVGKELDQLRKLQVQNLFFVDDNLIGDKAKAKGFLRFLKEYQNKHNYWFTFGTEASLNMAQDDELLRLFREANFKWVFIGIESPDKQSLKETKKHQNIRQDILFSVRKIYSYGIDIYGGFIIGFDNDTRDTFDRQFDFIIKSGIQMAMVGLLTALPKTPLFERLEKEGRLIPYVNHSDNTQLGTNFIPKQMSYDEMIEGYYKLYCRLFNYRNIASRIINKTRFISNPINRHDSSTTRSNIVWRFFVHGILKGGVSAWYHFLRSFPLLKPRLIPLIIQDWIIGLSMRDYVHRQFIRGFEKGDLRVKDYLASLEKAFQPHLKGGALELSFNHVEHAATNISINLKGILDQHFFNQAGHHIEKILKKTTYSITINIEELKETQTLPLNHMLEKLSKHGDRINIFVNQKLRGLIPINSSVFNLVLKERQ
jgi:radical SAM superfamily enzyme YgiQ (UPF0313 family)